MFNNLLFCVTNKQKKNSGGLKNNIFFNFSLQRTDNSKSELRPTFPTASLNSTYNEFEINTGPTTRVNIVRRTD